MNGKAEDRPPQNSVPLDHNHPTGDEIEKPEAERVIVELEYIKSKDLNNVAEVDAVLKVSIVLSCHLTVRRLSIFHKEEMLHLLEKVILFVVKSLKNPRSALTQLLLKSSQDKRFVCEVAERALVAMTTHVSPALLLPKLRPCLKNKSPRIRAKASACFSRCVPRLGIEGMREYGIETNSQNLRRLHGQSSWNLRQCIRKLLLSNPRRRIQRQPLGQSSANQTSHLLVHRLCFVSPMSLVRLERVLLRVHDTSPHYVPCSIL
ncbi:putative armadillo-like helical protein [Arabidopsis thaliana]